MSQESEVHSSRRRPRTNSLKKARRSRRSLLLSKKTQWQARIWAAARVQLQYISHLLLLSRLTAIKVTEMTTNTAHNLKDSKATSPARRIKRSCLAIWIGKKAKRMQTGTVFHIHQARSRSTMSHFSGRERTHRMVKAI